VMVRRDAGLCVHSFITVEKRPVLAEVLSSPPSPVTDVDIIRDEECTVTVPPVYSTPPTPTVLDVDIIRDEECTVPIVPVSRTVPYVPDPTLNSA
jgi:hypothetical protein